MENEKQSAILVIREMIPSEDNKEITHQRMVSYDMAPLRRLIEFGEIDFLIETLRRLHTEIVEASLMSFEKGDHGIFEDSDGLVHILFVIRELANCFDEIRQETYQRKEWPVVKIDPDKN